ncbi:lipopolysaccharide biosynthesis protein [Caldifermentibacillus hisashii]|uniref:lipopolysaccharide biosynthesis protein n=1 Tax=Caldifermentibacillus hisashii TaxID=996558 RepID=UPI003D1A11FB
MQKIKKLSSSGFRKDVLITILGQFIVLLVAFGLNKILSNRLGTDGFGEYSIAKRTADVITYIMLAGMGIAIPKYLSTYRQLGDRLKEARFIIAGLVILGLLSFVTIFTLLVFRIPFSGIIFGTNGYESFILPILLFSFSSALTTFVYSYYRGIDKFYIYNISQITVQITMLFIVLFFNDNVIKLLYFWSLAIGCYGIIVCLKVLKKYFPIALIKSPKRDLKPYIKELVSYCFPRIPGEFVLFSFTVVPIVIINYKLGIEISGFFSAALTLNSTINPLFSFVGLVLLPLVSKSIAGNQFSKVNIKVNTLGKIYLVIAIMGITFVEIFTPQLVNFFFSSDFQPSVSIIRIVILSVLPNAFYLLLRNPIDAVSKTPYNTINLTISFSVLIVLSFLSSSIIEFTWSIFISYTLLGFLSIWTWNKCKKSIGNENKITERSN